MDKSSFLESLQAEIATFNNAVATEDGDWIVKGFIDIARNIYTISVDTKVISKILELLLIPELARFAKANDLRLILTEHQNFYPDVSFVDAEGNRFALDLKSTYRASADRVNGMTLGAFTGYFRNRQSTKNISFPYDSYAGHFVLGMIYTRVGKDKVDEQRRYRLDDLEQITSVITDFQFFVQEKYRIATTRPGSGNTKNIGSITPIADLVSGSGPFAELGLEVFDDYWMFYLTSDMARAVDLPKPPYRNLDEYLAYKGLKQ